MRSMLGTKGEKKYTWQEVLPLLFLEGMEVPLWEVFEVQPPGEGEGA